MLQKLKKIWNKIFRKPFLIDFSYVDIEEKKIFQSKECFEEFLKMMKNMYISKLNAKRYIEAEIVREIIEELMGMYAWFYEDEKPENKNVVSDIVWQLQEKMKEATKNIWQ